MNLSSLRALLLWPLLVLALRAAPSTANVDHRLVPGDIVQIQVFQEPELDREVRVAHDGGITLPLVGRIAAAGLKLEELEEQLRARFADGFLVSPQVNAAVVRFQPRTVNVLGAVNSPQAIEYPPGQTLTLIDAISRAGGFNRLADRRRVRLTRPDPAGASTIRVVDADELLTGNHPETCTVQPDDVIFVHERVL